MISARDLRSLYMRWMSDVATNVWMRERRAYFTASQQRSMSPSPTRDRPQMIGAPSSVPTCLATSRVASKSSSEEIGNPASMTSTLSRASWRAISSFSIVFMENPGDCSPSRSVVSKMITRSMVWLLCSEVACTGLPQVAWFEMLGGCARRLSRPRRRYGTADEQSAHRTGRGVSKEDQEHEQLVIGGDDHDAEDDDEQRR